MGLHPGGRDVVWTFKNLLAIGLFLFGTTFLWMTAAFAGRTPPPTGVAWTVVNVLALVALTGFTIVAWGVLKGYSWWPTIAFLSSIVGLATVVPFTIGLRQIDAAFADLGLQINLWMHILGSAAVISIVRLPVVRDWVMQRL